MVSKEECVHHWVLGDFTEIDNGSGGWKSRRKKYRINFRYGKCKKCGLEDDRRPEADHHGMLSGEEV